MELQEPLDQMEQKVLRVQEALKGIRATLDLPVHPESKEQKEIQETKEIQGILGPEVNKELEALLVQTETRAQLEKMDPQDQRAMMVHLVRKELPGFLEHLERQGLEDNKD